MINAVLAWLNFSEATLYVCAAFIFMIALIVTELLGLKKRRSRAYRALVREGQARRSEMNLKMD